MRINFALIKYENADTSIEKTYSGTCKRDICIDFIFDKIRDWLICYSLGLPGIVSIFKSELIIYFDNIKLVISTNESFFNFEDYNSILRKKFEMISGGIYE